MAILVIFKKLIVWRHKLQEFIAEMVDNVFIASENPL